MPLSTALSRLTDIFSHTRSKDAKETPEAFVMLHFVRDKEPALAMNTAELLAWRDGSVE